jgi:hypothetical protein
MHSIVKQKKFCEFFIFLKIRTSRSSSVDSLIDSSCETKCINNENIKDETTANETTVKLNDLDDDHVDANGNASRQHLKQQQQNEQKQTSILINGKRYYRKFHIILFKLFFKANRNKFFLFIYFLYIFINFVLRLIVF